MLSKTVNHEAGTRQIRIEAVKRLLIVSGFLVVLGGCGIGSDREHGVIDKNHAVFGYQNMHVCDGSVIPANLGVNPSLTITAMTERCTGKIPSKT